MNTLPSTACRSANATVAFALGAAKISRWPDTVVTRVFDVIPFGIDGVVIDNFSLCVETELMHLHHDGISGIWHILERP